MRDQVLDAIEKSMNTPCVKRARELDRMRRYWHRKAMWRKFWKCVFPFWK